MTDKRVCFDFEATFSNGGGLQGQDFRLDIEGDDIDDDALAVYVIRDLRLLMVAELRILNKRVIAEPHKRSAAGTVDTGVGPTGGQVIADLSHAIEHGMTTYPGLPDPIICDHLSRLASRELYAHGTEFQIGRIDMVANTGTYLDTPSHRYEDGHDLAGLDLAKVADVPAVVVDLTGATDRAIGPEALAPHPIAGTAVLLRTDWDRFWGTDDYLATDRAPYLSAEGAAFLVEAGAVLVGIDSVNIDDAHGSGRPRPAHSALLAADIPILEHLTGLGQLPPAGARLHAVPPRIHGFGTFPTRAYAVVES